MKPLNRRRAQSDAMLRGAQAKAIRCAIGRTQPGLRVSTAGERIAVSGLFDVVYEDVPVDTFQIRIELSTPGELRPPSVYETAGRIPRELNRHVFSDGRLCLYCPAVYWLHGYDKKPLDAFLEGPVRNFFLFQCAREHGVAWPHGELSHAAIGFLEFYSDLFRTSGEEAYRLLSLVVKQTLRPSAPCPCSRSERRPIADCHPELLNVAARVPRAQLTHAVGKIAAALQRCGGSMGLLHFPIATPAALGAQEHVVQ